MSFVPRFKYFRVRAYMNLIISKDYYYTVNCFAFQILKGKQKHTDTWPIVIHRDTLLHST